jgi:hypothetical protein
MSESTMFRSMKLERINLYLSENVEELLSFVRGEITYTLLGFNLATDEAYIEDGEGIGTLPPLQDEEIEVLYEQILRRYHARLGHST